MKILVVEGIDCSGKTTLISEVRKRLGRGVSHPLIIDRFVYSNYVYEKMNGRDRLELGRIVYKFFDNFPMVVVYIDIDVNLAHERMRTKEDHFKYTIEELGMMKVLFEEAFSVLGGRIHRINMEDPEKDYGEVVRLLV